jgi:hypothetical protein
VLLWPIWALLQGQFPEHIKKSSLRLSGQVNSQCPAYTKIIGGVCGNNRFHKSGDIILTLSMVKLKSHFSLISCTSFSEYVPKQMALGEPKHVLWQSLESIHI